MHLKTFYSEHNAGSFGSLSSGLEGLAYWKNSGQRKGNEGVFEEL